MGLEQTYFTVAQDVGEIVVCARVSFPDIDCPIVFPFEVKLTNSDRSSSKSYGYSLWCVDRLAYF